MSRRYEWSWSVTVGGDTDAAGYVLEGATIRYGRSVWYSQPDPPTARLTLLASESGPPALLAPVVIGYTLDAYTNDYRDPYASGSGRRFTGRIVSVTYEPGAYIVEAVGSLEKANRVPLAPNAWPAETDVARVGRVLTLAGVTHRTAGTPRVRVLARPADGPVLNAGAHARDVATWGGGMLTETRDGTVVYLTAERLSKPPRTVTPDRRAVLVDGWTSTLEAGSIVNSVTVAYGAAQPQATVTLPHQASIAAFGTRDLAVTTDLEDSSDANEYASMVLANRAQPAWQLPAVTVAVHLQPQAAIGGLLALEAGDLVRIPGAPVDAPYADYLGRVQGWTEVLGLHEWTITYDLARGDLVPLGTVTWGEPTPAYTWAGQSITWDQAVTLDNLTPA